MDNRWASPEGYAQPPTAVRYEILDGDEVVQRETVSAWDHGRSRYYHCLQGKDQRMANEITALIQQACEYFYVPDGEYEPMEGVTEVTISNDKVRNRIDRINQGENTREAERSKLKFYPLDELPFETQRALIERIEECKRAHSFRILGEVKGD